ncbi:MAG: FixH family protein, partial [Bacteroidota bacterium]|nr:FixH family protein [Bacteroidota bacterium]
LIACGIFITFAMTQNLNLVEDDYYKKGANYTEQMEIDKRSAKYLNTIYIQDDGEKISIFFPDGFAENLKNGTMLFFRPSDNNNDITFEINDQSNVQSIDKKKLIKGRYIVKISWQSDSRYYIEKDFFVK